MIISKQFKIPDSQYCFKKSNSYESCQYFNNARFYKCNLGFNDLKETDKGIIKSKECINSPEVLIKEV